MSALITQYLMPFGAFQHESENDKTMGTYSRVFDPVTVQVMHDTISKRGAGTIKFDLYEGVSIIDSEGVEIQISTAQREFYRVLADYAKISEIPKDMQQLDFKFQGPSQLAVSVYPHEYSPTRAAEIYVPEFKEKVILRKDLWEFLTDFCVTVETSRKYLSYRGRMINL